MAEVLGAKSCILVKNVEGLYSANPGSNPDAEFIAECSAKELIERDLEDLVMERKLLYLLQDARHVKEVKIVNGHNRGNIEKAILGETVGSRIFT